jgi:hypothetical protein
MLKALLKPALIMIVLIAPVGLYAGDDNYSVNTRGTVKTPDIDTTQEPEEEEPPVRTDTNYDVKKSHDEHIPATERAAGRAAEKAAESSNDE